MTLYEYRPHGSSLGRFFSRDPIGEDGGNNIYLICNNNAIQYVDKDGKSIFGPRWENKRKISKELLLKAVCVLKKFGFSNNWALRGSLTLDPTIYIAEGPITENGEMDWLGGYIVINSNYAREDRIVNLSATLLHEFTHYYWIFAFDKTGIPARVEDSVYDVFNSLNAIEETICCSVNGKTTTRKITAMNNVLCDCNIEGCIKCE